MHSKVVEAVFSIGSRVNGAKLSTKDLAKVDQLDNQSGSMTFTGLSEGTKGYIFMRSPNNMVFTAVQALFDKMLFPKCLNMH